MVSTLPDTNPHTLNNSQPAACKSCGTPVTANYCASCGQAVKLKRFDSHYLSHEIQHLLHFEKGILFTIKELLIRPGKNIRGFIAEDRSRLVKPVVFIIITSLIYSTITHLFHVEDGYVSYSGDSKSTVSVIMTWIEGHYGYANIMMGVFIALWLKLFFKRSNYNFYEILVLLCFVMGMGMLLFAVFAIAVAVARAPAIMQIGAIVAVAYCSWAIGQFFSTKKVGGYLKAFAAYFLGYISFFLLAMGTGVLIDSIFKH